MKVAFFYPGYESIGVEYLVSVLEQNGHQCELFFDPILFSENTMIQSSILGKIFNYKNILKDKFKEFDPDIACFSVVSDDYNWALRNANEIKGIKNIPVLFGGIHATSLPEIVLKEESVDFIIRGEGEYALLDFLKNINADYSKIKNLCYKKNGKIIINEIRPLIKDLDQLPYPNKEIFYNKAKSINCGYLILTARGCPFNCTYCNNNVLKKLYNKTTYLRRRSVDNVIAELKIAKNRFRFNHVKFIDELFTFNKKWLYEFSEKYVKEVGLPFYISVHPNTIDEETVMLLKKSLCHGVVMGIQTTDYEINKNILHRNTTGEQILTALQLFKKHKLKCMVDIMFGIPALTEDKIKKSLEFFNEATPDLIRIFWLRYYPKIDIIETAKEYGLLKDNDIQRIEKSIDVKGFLKGGDTYKKNLNKYANFLFLYPIIPQAVRIFLLRTGIYRILGLLPPYMIMFLFMRIIIIIRGIKFYTYTDRVKLKYREFIPKIIYLKIMGKIRSK